MEEALWVAEAKCLALDAFSIVKADCFWEGFEEFWDIAAERYPDLDFSFIMPNKGGVEVEDEEQVEANQEDIVVVKGAIEGEQGLATEGVVEEQAVATPGEVNRGEVIPKEGEVAYWTIVKILYMNEIFFCPRLCVSCLSYNLNIFL